MTILRDTRREEFLKQMLLLGYCSTAGLPMYCREGLHHLGNHLPFQNVQRLMESMRILDLIERTRRCLSSSRLRDVRRLGRMFFSFYHFELSLLDFSFKDLTEVVPEAENWYGLGGSLGTAFILDLGEAHSTIPTGSQDRIKAEAVELGIPEQMAEHLVWRLQSIDFTSNERPIHAYQQIVLWLAEFDGQTSIDADGVD